MGANVKSAALPRRIGFTLGALLVYRLGLFIPLPGIDIALWEQIFRSQAGGVLGAANMLSGGAIARLSILALNIIPYLSAAVLLQLVSLFWSKLSILKDDGEAGRVSMDRWIRLLTVLLALFQAYGVAGALEGIQGVVSQPGGMFLLTTTLSLTGGTIFLVWLCDLIRARGVGHGLSLILSMGIAVEVPAGIAGILELMRQGMFSQGAIAVLCLVAFVLTALVVRVERARRRLSVSFPGRGAGQPMLDGQLSFKLNSAGALIPTWLASWFLSLSYLVVSLVPALQDSVIVDQFAHRGPLFLVVYAVLIFGFALLYTAFVLSPDDTARSLERHGGRLAGVEPGEATAAVLDRFFSRIALTGAAYLALVCLVPEILVAYMGVPFYFGGASLLIVVCTVLDLGDEIRGAGMLKARGARL